MEKYSNYCLDDLLLDKSFREWVREGAIFENTVWEELIRAYPEKKEIVEEAILLIREWKRGPSALSDAQLTNDVGAIMRRIGRNTAAAKKRAWMNWIGYAAAVVLLLFLGGYLLDKKPTSEVLSSNAAHQLEITNAETEDRVIALPDGSTVRLTPGSRLAYLSDFGKTSTRNIELEGDAFFDVVRDTLHPFSVYTGGVVTRVLGTSFTVRSIGGDVSVTVSTGKVSVSGPDGKSAPMVLTPNQKAVYKAREQSLTRTLAEEPVVVDPEKLKDQFAFDDKEAAEIFRALEKAYGLPILFDENTIRDCRVTLPFREEPFYEKLEILCRTIGATYKISDDGIRIESKGCAY